jgi:hypothetical protein
MHRCSFYLYASWFLCAVPASKCGPHVRHGSVHDTMISPKICYMQALLDMCNSLVVRLCQTLGIVNPELN